MNGFFAASSDAHQSSESFASESSPIQSMYGPRSSQAKRSTCSPMGSSSRPASSRRCARTRQPLSSPTYSQW